MPRLSRDQLYEAVLAEVPAQGSIEHEALVQSLYAKGQGQAENVIHEMTQFGRLVASVVAVGGDKPAEVRYSLPE